MTRRLRLGTRGSELALWQASFVARRLAALHPSLEVEVAVLGTKGDREADRPLTEIGGSGVFVKEIEHALLRGEVDFAVHSLKDLATTMPDGLVLAAVPERADPADVLVAREPTTLDSLPRGAAVGTGSPRRRALLLHRRPDLRVVPLRGNVPTRVEKVRSGGTDAAVLAKAGLDRLGRTDLVREVLDPAAFPPAPGQGALALQCRGDDGGTLDLLALLDHRPTRVAVTAEREFLRTLGSGCHLAAGAYGRLLPDGATFALDAFLSDPDGREMLVARRRGGGTEAAAREHGREAARSLLGRATQDLLLALRGGARGAVGGEE